MSLTQFHGCWKKWQAPQPETKDSITHGKVVSMSFMFVPVPLSCMAVTQRWVWGGCCTHCWFATQVRSSEHMKHNLLKGAVSKLAQPLPQREILSLLFWKAKICPLLWREALSLYFKVVCYIGPGLGWGKWGAQGATFKEALTLILLLHHPVSECLFKLATLGTIFASL